MNKGLNKFYFYSAKYWKGKIRGRFNVIFVVSISFLFFLILFPFCFSCFNFHSILYRFNDLLYRLNDIISRLNEIFFVLISVLISLFQFLFLMNIGMEMEMSLPGFRTKAIILSIMCPFSYDLSNIQICYCFISN